MSSVGLILLYMRYFYKYKRGHRWAPEKDRCKKCRKNINVKVYPFEKPPQKSWRNDCKNLMKRKRLLRLEG